MWLRIARAHPIGILEAYLLRYRRGHGSSSGPDLSAIAARSTRGELERWLASAPQQK